MPHRSCRTRPFEDGRHSSDPTCQGPPTAANDFIVRLCVEIPLRRHRQLALFPRSQRHLDVDRPIRGGAVFQDATVQPPLQTFVPQVESLSQGPAARGEMRDLFLDERVNPDVRVKVKGPSGREGFLGRGSRLGEKVPGEVTRGLVMDAVGKAPGASREEADIGGYRPGLEGPE